MNEQAIEFSNMQSKIEELQQQLTRRQSERSIAPVESNFDDPNWMLHFMEELKTRTLKGASEYFELH